MRDEVLKVIYSNPVYLSYLREHPKWYFYLEQDVKYLKNFENVVKKETKTTTYDKLENVKKQVNFASSMLNYFTK